MGNYSEIRRNKNLNKGKIQKNQKKSNSKEEKI